MAIYRKIPQCRICKSVVGDRIDQDILDKVHYREIMRRHGAAFTPEAPITLSGLKSHAKHLRQAVEAAAAEVVKPVGPPATRVTREPHDPARQQIFQAAVRNRINEQEVLEELLESSMADVREMSAPEDPKATPDKNRMFKRDRVRMNASKIALTSATVKQMQLEADADRHRFEMGRIMFRMLELMGRSLLTLPAEFRTLAISEVKKMVRNDDELNALLREQQAAQASAPTAVAATVDGVPVPAVEGPA